VPLHRVHDRDLLVRAAHAHTQHLPSQPETGRRTTWLLTVIDRVRSGLGREVGRRR
jgi:hypothetical protein